MTAVFPFPESFPSSAAFARGERARITRRLRMTEKNDARCMLHETDHATDCISYRFPYHTAIL